MLESSHIGHLISLEDMHGVVTLDIDGKIEHQSLDMEVCRRNIHD
jgi:hypothetical protein